MTIQTSPRKLNDKELRVAYYFEQLYTNSGRVPTSATLAQGLKTVGIDLIFVEKCMNDEFFQKALQSRGFPVGSVSISEVLEPKQIMAINAILNFDDPKTLREKLKDLDIKYQTYQNWLKNKHFKDYMTKQLWAKFANADSTAIMNLLKAVSEGSENALKIFLEMRGHYTKTISVDFNPMVAINRIVEIISRHVDPNTFDDIADEIERTVLGRNMVGKNNTMGIAALPEAPVIIDAVEVHL